MPETDDLKGRDDAVAPAEDQQKADPAPVEAHPISEETPKPVTKLEKRRGGFVAPLLGGVLAAAAGFGLAQVVPGGWPFPQTAELEQQIAAQSSALQQLEARLAAVESQPAPDISPLMDTLATLNGRIAGLETGPAEAAEGMATLAQDVAKLRADLAALQASGPVPANITALAAEAEARLQEAEAQAAQLKAEAEALNKAAADRVALVALQSALEKGAPFAAELSALDAEIPDSLRQHAETGLPSLAILQDTFPDAARAALEAALRADMGESWTDRATSFLRSQTGARSLNPREGSDPDAILSRAEAALKRGDLTGALAELSNLPEVSQSALSDWRAMAETRLAAEAALKDLAENIGG